MVQVGWPRLHFNWGRTSLLHHLQVTGMQTCSLCKQVMHRECSRTSNIFAHIMFIKQVAAGDDVLHLSVCVSVSGVVGKKPDRRNYISLQLVFTPSRPHCVHPRGPRPQAKASLPGHQITHPTAQCTTTGRERGRERERERERERTLVFFCSLRHCH